MSREIVYYDEITPIPGAPLEVQVLPGNTGHWGRTLKLKLFNYQEAGAVHLSRNRYAALFWKPGMGKTIATLEGFKRVRELGRVPADLPLLVVAPLLVAQTVWSAEIDKWFPGFSWHILHGKGKTEAALAKSVDVFIINYEGLKWLLPLVMKGKVEFAGIVFDELTKMKDTSTQRFRKIRPCLPKFRFRWGLTGTPTPNSIMEVFGQVMVLDGGKRLGKYITDFRKQYCYQANKYEWKVLPEEVEVIRDKISDICLHIDYKDAGIQAPPRMPDVIHRVPLPASAMAVYRKMEKDLYLELGDKEITAASAGVLVGKLQQISQGFLYAESEDGEGRDVEELHTTKLDFLEDFVDEMNGEPLLVVYKFNEDLRRLQARFPKGVNLASDVKGVCERFKSGVDVPEVVFLQPQNAAHGVDGLQRSCSTMIMYALEYSNERDEQVCGRLDRQGQDEPVVVHRLVAEGTVDETILEIQAGRGEDQKAMLQAMRRRISEVLGV